MFTPPREFAINIPRMMSEARLIGYQRWSWPEVLAKSFSDRRVSIALAGFAEALVLILALFLVGPKFFLRHVGSGSFYQVIPYMAMVLPSLILALYWLAIWIRNGFRFWSEAGDPNLRQVA